MGIIFSRWKKKQSRSDVLNDLTKKIDGMERKRQGTMDRQKRVVTMWLLYSVLLYLISALVLFFYFLPDEFLWKLVYSLPFFIFPLLILLIKRFLHWYYVKNIKKNEKELERLKKKKHDMLNEIKAMETYNVAQELLQRFDSDNSSNNFDLSIFNNTTLSAKKLGGPEGSLRHRGKHTKIPNDKSTLTSPQQQQQQSQQQQVPKLPFDPPQMPQSSLKKNSLFDRLVDYLLSDGPGNRYALICHHCQCHNGLALKEEFEFISFRCSYCSYLNKAPKQKPKAPTISPSTSNHFITPTPDHLLNHPSTPKQPRQTENLFTTPKSPINQQPDHSTPLMTSQSAKESKSE